MQLQSNLSEHVQSPGGADFNAYRAYKSQVRREAAPQRFVDGELVERFLELPEHLKDEVATGTGMDAEGLTSLIEGLQALH